LSMACLSSATVQHRIRLPPPTLYIRIPFSFQCFSFCSRVEHPSFAFISFFTAKPFQTLRLRHTRCRFPVTAFVSSVCPRRCLLYCCRIHRSAVFSPGPPSRKKIKVCFPLGKESQTQSLALFLPTIISSSFCCALF
jgi:hypothetical protein